MTDMQEPKAAVEALSFLRLFKRGQNLDSLRRDIGLGSPHRIRVRLVFDSLVSRLGKDGKVRDRVNTKAVSPLLRAVALKLLQDGLSHATVQERLPGLGPGVILEISKACDASFHKRGRGRRLSPELKRRILARVRQRARSSELQKEFGIDYDTTVKFRNLAGDFENRRHWKKLSPSDIRKAESQLAAGGRWRDVAATFNVSLATLQKRCSYRKRADKSP